MLFTLSIICMVLALICFIESRFLAEIFAAMSGIFAAASLIIMVLGIFAHQSLNIRINQLKACNVKIEQEVGKQEIYAKNQAEMQELMDNKVIVEKALYFVTWKTMEK